MYYMKTLDELGNYIKLNVGGRLFQTTLDTLVRKQGNMISAMFSGHMNLTVDENGCVLIDRPGDHFEKILNYLQTNEICLPKDIKNLSDFLKETEYYCLNELSEKINDKLQALYSVKSQLNPAKSAILIFDDNADLVNFINLTSKPVVQLTMNRKNNAFSYDNNSDVNLLRNVECLEKHAIQYQDKIRFVKDISMNHENNQICKWSFHYRKVMLYWMNCVKIHNINGSRILKIAAPEEQIRQKVLQLIDASSRGLSEEELQEISRQNEKAREQLSFDNDDNGSESNAAILSSSGNPVQCIQSSSQRNTLTSKLNRR